MKLVFFTLILSCFDFCPVATQALASSLKKEVDLVLEGLEKQEWLENEKPCLDQMLLVLNNVKNYTVWAVWIWNSMQNPVGSFYGSKYSLGNYDQCMKAPSNSANSKIKTQYCLADVELTNKEEQQFSSIDVFGETNHFLNVRTKAGRKLDTITWGACLPAACHHQSVLKILNTIYLVNPLSSVDPNITVDYCEKAGIRNEYSLKFYLFITLTLTLITTAFLSTFYLQYDDPDSTLSQIAYCFSLKRNWSSFTKKSDEDIPVLSFTKTVGCIFVTILHVFMYSVMVALSNGRDFDYLFSVKNNTLGNTVQHIDLPAIENFFVISGLLSMKGLMENKKGPIIMLIQRYVRFIASFSMLIFYSIAVLEYTADGPLWNRFAKAEQKYCSKNWLVGLLMLNNYVDSENICQLVTWYIPCDYHLTVMATALFCLWNWNKRVGKVIATLAVIFSVLGPGVVTYWNRLRGIVFYDVDKMIDLRTNDVFVNIYMKSHHRTGSYLLGMAMGYIIMEYRPSKYRGAISKESSYFGLAIAFILSIRVLAAAPAWCLGEYNAWNSAVYATLNRNIWALATCACIAITEYGDVQILRNIMAWPGFTIVSRLAYGIYITHSLILQRSIYSQRNPIRFDIFEMILNGIGVLLVSAMLAILLWLFVESPLSNLTNLILNPKKKLTSNKIENRVNINGTNATDLKNAKEL